MLHQMRISACLWAVIVVVQAVVPATTDALKLRIPAIRRHKQQSFLQRRYRRLDVQEETARQRTGVPGFTGINRRRLLRRKEAEEAKALPLIPYPQLDEQPEPRAPKTAETASATSPNYIPWKQARGARTIKKAKVETTIVTDVHELRRRVLDEGMELRKVPVALDVANVTNADLLNHEVVQLIVKRFHSQSMPGKRGPADTAKLALSMEGGGMRGAVSAGMAAAIASLGLCDTFDTIYGSSAGSVIGAYMVSRQMCMDVYVDILPAAQRSFVCLKRLFSALAVSAVDWALSHVQNDLPQLAHRYTPGMNISFVLDGIMDETHGVRPLDLKSFRENDKKQPLRVASSYVKNHKLYTKSFGTKDFFPEDNLTELKDGQVAADSKRQGLFACLQASMTVPGATGPPIRIRDGNETLPFFDAFCFEPLPYRSAVEEGATHCLVLCSRPEGFQPKTKPGVYEKAVAPLYFKSHGEPAVVGFFEKGGQQYIYAEDLLTLEEGKRAGLETDGRGGVHVPPPKILYGVERDTDTETLASRREDWKKAHLLPLKVPLGTPELSPLEQGREEVLEAVRGGYAAAFDLLAPALGLELHSDFTGDAVAKLVFPDACIYDGSVLEGQLRINGDSIDGSIISDPARRRKRDAIARVVKFVLRRKNPNHSSSEQVTVSLPSDHSDVLLSLLPGFKSGNLAHLAEGLRRARTML